MIRFSRHVLSNGLPLIVHEDPSTPLATVNLLYKVGARDEDPKRTGFAHLFEHLMFGGSVNIPEYDSPLQLAGGDNNAFTNNDITNYYCTLPANNLETALWLESDRMLSLAFSEKSLDVQRQVVVEEFKQRYLNQPYGDVWLLLRPLAYKRHPYQWATIGKEISHIEQATLQDVRDFFFRYYTPDNAVLVVAGGVQEKKVVELAEKWFGDIRRDIGTRAPYDSEPRQEEERRLTVKRDIPFDALYMAFHACSRLDDEFYATDLMTDVLSRGKSSRLYNVLVKEKKLFSDVSAYLTGEFDKSLVIIEGKLLKGVSIESAEKEVRAELDRIMTEPVAEHELDRVKNKVESTIEFSEMDLSSRALSLAIADYMGDPDLVNTELMKYQAVSIDDVQRVAMEVFRPTNASILYYLSNH
ncbi:MAG: M16 family metallopeptidase [Bacteroidota bacterium]